MELVDYAKLYSPQTDKYDLGYVDEFYNKFFEPRRYSVQSLLEVGIAYGGSLLLWRDYFPNATIMGIDIYGCDSWFKEDTESYTHKYIDSRSSDMSKHVSVWRERWHELMNENANVKFNFIGENK